jgi:hypothetical protein
MESTKAAGDAADVAGKTGTKARRRIKGLLVEGWA